MRRSFLLGCVAVVLGGCASSGVPVVVYKEGYVSTDMGGSFWTRWLEVVPDDRRFHPLELTWDPGVRLVEAALDEEGGLQLRWQAPGDDLNPPGTGNAPRREGRLEVSVDGWRTPRDIGRGSRHAHLTIEGDVLTHGERIQARRRERADTGK